MSNWYENYDDEIDSRSKGQTDLDLYFAKRESEIAEREAQLREREREALEYYHSSEAKQAADAAKWRQVTQEITPDMRGADIIRLYKKHGI